ncbi:MAG TPA: SRPBCC domain-containing protein [Phycisphaerales bacterium]|nr:SRPBCC domain-containing protein [Phycisphaerales bacterium]
MIPSPHPTAPFRIARTFNAPLDTVWRAWTDPNRLTQWWGPKGVTATIKAFELRPGGVWHCALQAPGGPVMWGKYTFREITPKSRLVFTVSFSDEHGNLIKHPLSPDWPMVILSEVDFAESGGRTTINVRWTPVDATEVEARTFTDGAPSMTAGWTGTFDQFQAWLATVKD